MPWKLCTTVEHSVSEDVETKVMTDCLDAWEKFNHHIYVL